MAAGREKTARITCGGGGRDGPGRNENLSEATGDGGPSPAEGRPARTRKGPRGHTDAAPRPGLRTTKGQPKNKRVRVPRDTPYPAGSPLPHRRRPAPLACEVLVIAWGVSHTLRRNIVHPLPPGTPLLMPGRWGFASRSLAGAWRGLAGQ